MESCVHRLAEATDNDNMLPLTKACGVFGKLLVGGYAAPLVIKAYKPELSAELAKQERPLGIKPRLQSALWRLRPKTTWNPWRNTWLENCLN